MYARFIYISVLVFCLACASTVEAQERGVSIPDVFTNNSADTFVAQEVTSALRVAGGMTRDWRPSTADVPIAELMRACGASLDTDPQLECLSRMIVTRDASMAGGLVLFGFMAREGEDNGFSLILALYDMRTGEIARRLTVEVDRIMAPAARNRMAAGWINQLTAPTAVAIAAQVYAPDHDVPVASTEPVVPDPEPIVPRPRGPIDTTLPDTIGWILVGTAAASAIAASIFGGLVLSLDGDERYNAYRASWDGTRVHDACDVAAMDMSADGRYALGVCNDAEAYQILTGVFWAATGVFALAGAIFIIWHPGASERAPASPVVRLTPNVGPTAANLDLTVEF